MIDAAQKLDQSSTAVMLAQIERTGSALGDKSVGPCVVTGLFWRPLKRGFQIWGDSELV